MYIRRPMARASCGRSHFNLQTESWQPSPPQLGVSLDRICHALPPKTPGDHEPQQLRGGRAHRLRADLRTSWAPASCLHPPGEPFTAGLQRFRAASLPGNVVGIGRAGCRRGRVGHGHVLFAGAPLFHRRTPGTPHRLTSDLHMSPSAFHSAMCWIKHSDRELP